MTLEPQYLSLQAEHTIKISYEKFFEKKSHKKFFFLLRFIINIRGAKAPKKKKRHVSNRKVICLEIEIDPF